MPRTLFVKSLIKALGAAAAVLASSSTKADVLAGTTRVPMIDRTWSWGDSMGGGGDDSFTSWQLDASGVTEKITEVAIGTPGGIDYAHAKVRATFTRNVLAGIPLRIDIEDSSEGSVLPSSSHTWDYVSIKLGTSNTADFIVSGGYYRYDGPAPLQYKGSTIQPGGVVGPGLCWVQNFPLPEASLKVYRGTNVQNAPHHTVIDFTFTPLCPSDFNHDGFVNGNDYDAFVDAFVAGDLAADFDGNSYVNGDDYDAFVTAFEAGC